MPYIIKDKLAFLLEASKILSSSLDYNVTLAIVAKLVVNNIADYCIIDVLEGNKLERLVVKVSDRTKQSLANEMFNYPPDPNNKLAIYDAAKTGEPIIIKEVTDEWLKSVSKHPREREIVKELKLTSHVFAPLISRGKVIGVLTIASMEKGFSYDRQDVQYIKEIATRAGIAVDNARLFSQAQEALRTRDEFLSIASHELKTPLTSVLLNLQLILHKIHNAANEKIEMSEIVNMIEISKKQSERMSRLITDLLNISVISTGRLQVEREPLDLSGLVDDILNRFTVQFEKAHMKVILKNRKPVWGHWDRIRLEQVISNLISNAIKYGKSKPLTVEVMHEKGRAIVKVKDRGIGIKEKDMAHIFERFKRAVSSKDFKGLGVGLYISRQIVEAHGGTLSVKSTEKNGSTFIVDLPLE